MEGGRGSFDCVTASLPRSRYFAQDDKSAEDNRELKMTGRATVPGKTGSRSSPSEANRGNVHLNRIWRSKKSCPGVRRFDRGAVQRGRFYSACSGA
jgi:hypothetical protein